MICFQDFLCSLSIWLPLFCRFCSWKLRPSLLLLTLKLNCLSQILNECLFGHSIKRNLPDGFMKHAQKFFPSVYIIFAYHPLSLFYDRQQKYMLLMYILYSPIIENAWMKWTEVTIKIFLSLEISISVSGWDFCLKIQSLLRGSCRCNSKSKQSENPNNQNKQTEKTGKIVKKGPGSNPRISQH